MRHEVERKIVRRDRRHNPARHTEREAHPVGHPGAPSTGIISPHTRLASSAETTIVSRARDTSIRPSARILPASLLIVRARSSLRSVIRSAALRRISYRWCPVRRRMTFAPASRPARAASTSAALASGTCSTSESSNGLRTSSTRPVSRQADWKWSFIGMGVFVDVWGKGVGGLRRATRR